MLAVFSSAVEGAEGSVRRFGFVFGRKQPPRSERAPSDAWSVACALSTCEREGWFAPRVSILLPPCIALPVSLEASRFLPWVSV